MSLPHKDWELFEPDVSDFRSSEDQVAEPFLQWPLGEPRTYAEMHQDVWDGIVDGWRATVLAYEAGPDDFYHAWYYLDDHPVFWQRMTRMGLPSNHVSAIHHNGGVQRGLEIFVFMDDGTGKISLAYDMVPTEWEKPDSGWHAWFLDGGSDTYERMIILAARKVWEYYGNDMSRRPPAEMGMAWLEENGFIESEKDADGSDEDARPGDVEQDDEPMASDAER
jgi:hypothetical protein